MAGQTGAWFVMPRGPYEAFMDLYAAEAEAGVEMYVVERPMEVMPILVDLDFRFEEGSGLARRYTARHVRAIVDAYMQCARELFVFEEVEVYVMEKTAPRLGTAGEVKDGLHIVVPGIVSYPKVMRLLRRDVLGRLGRVLNDVGIANAVEDCVDEAVITTNGWLMYGSCKGPGQEPYRVTGVYRWTGGFETLGEAERCEKGSGELAKLLSIRLPEFMTRLRAGVEERAEQAFPPREPRVESAAPAVVKGTQAWSAEVEYARALVGLLSVARADAYKSWRNVGLVLHGLDVGLLDAWVEFSRKSEKKFSQEGCELEWARMRSVEEVRNPLRIGSLVKWAKEDDPEGFERVLRSSGRYNEYAVAVENLVGLKERIGDEELKVTGGQHGVAQFDSAKVGAGCVDLTSFLVNDRRSVYPPDGFLAHLQSSSGELDRVLVRFAREGTDGVKFETTEGDPDQRTRIVAKLNPGTCTVQSLGIKRPGKVLKNLTDKVLMNSVTSVMFAGIQQYLADMHVPMAVTRQLRQEHVLYGNPQFFKIEGDNATVVVNNSYDEGGRSRHRPDMDIAEELKAAGVLDGVVMLPDGHYYMFDGDRCLWEHASVTQVTTAIRLAVHSDACKEMDASDVDYVRSDVGAVHVLKAISGMLIDRDFFAKLDQPVLGCAPWANGMFDALSGEMRSLAREDLVSMTTGYDLICREDVPAEAFEQVESFYGMLFPRKDEMAIFRQVIANALFGVGNAKHFLVLSDLSGGNNGKTTLMTLVESVFGSFAAGRNRNLLMSSQRLDPCAHQGDILAYAGKRVGFVDEPPMGGTLDVARIKDLTSGASKQTGRGVGSAKVMTFVWRALIVLSANQASFPQMNASSDEAFLRRMIALIMRAKFVDEGTPRAVGERLTHTIDVNVLNKLRIPECLSAHVHILADSFRQYTAANGVIALPADSKKFVMTIVCESDPLFSSVEEFLQEHVELAPEGVICEPELMGRVWDWLSSSNSKNFLRDKKTKFRDLLRAGVKRMGDNVKHRDSLQIAGERLRSVFTGVRWKTSFEC
jgi:hypothetical protein